jgi:uncharacterized membrane protein YidH (DUF202 family)
VKKKYWDLASGSVLLLFSAVLFIGAQRVKTLAVSSIGSGFFPSVVAVLLAITSVAIIIGGIVQARKPDAASGKEKAEDKPRVWGVIGTFALMAFYAILLPKLGFLITTTVYLFVQINILSPRESRKQFMFGIISVVTAVVIYYTFVKVFHLMLPAGILG